MSSPDYESELQSFVAEMNHALCSNDAAVISEFLSDEWVMAEGTQGVVRKDPFLQAIRESRLVHTQMQKEVVQTMSFGETALLITKGKNVGSYNGQKFDAAFLVSHLLRKKGALWQCVFTQETAFSCGPEPECVKCV